MIEKLREFLEPFESDESILFAAVYTVDGTPLIVHLKHRDYVSVLEWAERQIDVVSRLILEERLESAEFRFGGEGILFSPISQSLIMVVGTSDEASLYKLRIDTRALRKML